MLVLGIDGGGTKTHALALDETGAVVGHGVAGPSNYHSIGLDKALAVFNNVAQQALGDQIADCAVGCLGACDLPRDETNLTNGILGLGFARSVQCYNDVFAPLRVGSRFPYGVAVTCGSGFNACGIATDGRKAQLVSLGSWTGDWGGGTDLGGAAMAAVYRAADWRGEPTILTDLVLNALNMPDLIAIAEQIETRQLTPQRVASLARLVFEAADGGDKPAQAIIKRLANEIVTAASAFLRRLDMAEMDVDVVLSGGLTQGRGTLLFDTVIALLAERHPLASLRRATVAPVLGAALLAFDALHVAPPDVSAIHLPDRLVMASMPG